MFTKYRFATSIIASCFILVLCTPANAGRGSVRSAPIYGLSKVKTRHKKVSKSTIRDAVKGAALGVLNRGKFRGSMSVAEFNRIDTTSLRLKSIMIRPDQIAHSGERIGYNDYALRPSQVLYEARFEATLGGKAKTIYMRSELDIAKTLPRFESRVTTPKHYGGMRSKPFNVADPLTIGWID